MTEDRQPDLVDFLMKLFAERHPDLLPIDLDAFETALRTEFGGDRHWVRKAKNQEREALIDQVLRTFNGRNASELARNLKISRQDVYRIIKTPGRR